MRSIMEEKLKSSRIAIYGFEEHSDRFMADLCEVFSEIIHLSDFPEEVEKQPLEKYGIYTVLFDDYTLDENTYIVITGEFIRSQNKLKVLKLQEYRDYASIHIVRAVMWNKKLVTVMGNGAMSQLTAALKVCPEFSKKYHIKYYNNGNLYRGRIRTYQEYQHVAQMSDVYIYSMFSEAAWQKNIINRKLMVNDCQYIAVSANRFNGFHPQLDMEGRLSPYCFREEEMRPIPSKYYAFAIFDFVMNRMIENGVSEGDIIEQLTGKNLFTEDEIRANFENAIENVKKSDEIADIPLAEEFCKRARDIIVSRSLEEYHHEIIAYIMERVFQILGHEEQHCNAATIREAISEYSGSEIPVYPCVLEYFGLNNPQGVYRIMTYHRIRAMDFREYASYYADYCKNVRNLKEIIYFEDDGMITNVLDYFDVTSHQYGSKIAIEDGKSSIRYAQLRRYAQSIGSCLINEFGKTKQPVAVLMNKSAQSVGAFLGIIYSGNFYCPIDETMPEERIRKILSVLKPMTIITDDENQEKAEQFGIPVISRYEAGGTEIEFRKLEQVRRSMLDTDPLYVLFTSGSTGFPKGVLVSHRSIIDSVEWISRTFDFTNYDVMGNQSPFYFDNSTFDIFTGFKHGCRICIIPKELFAFPVKLLEYMEAKKITAICWVPSALCLVANAKALAAQELTCLNKVFFCGEVMPNKQLNMWRKALPSATYVNLYGMTEITMNCTWYVVDREFADNEPLPIGKPCNNTEILLLDEKGQRVTGDEIGEIYVRGTGLASGYYGNREQTEKAFVQNPLHSQYTDIIYKTGDLGRYNKRGELMYMGRRDYQIKHKGYRIELGEIETAAGICEDISAAACIYDEKRNKIVLFYSGTPQETKTLKAEFRKQLPEYMVPDKLIYLEQLPGNTNGKIDRKALKEDFYYGTSKKSD